MGTVPRQESVSEQLHAALGTFKMALLICLRSLGGARAHARARRRAGKIKNMIRGLARK